MAITKPSYILVQEALRKKIEDGEWKPGDKIPSEKDLEKEFSLSRVTIAKGITNLVSDGMLWRSRGKGTFVSSDNNIVGHRNLVKYISPGSSRGVQVRHGVIEAMYDVFVEHDYHTAIDFYRGSEDLAKNIERDIDDCHAGFIIFYDHSVDVLAQLRRLQAEELPFVLVDSYPEELDDVDFVVNDNLAGGSILINHLIELGHRRITYVTRPLDRSSLSDRVAGVLRGMAVADLELSPRSILKLTQSREGAQSELNGAVDEILSWSERPTALAFCNDDLAIQAIDYLESLGIRVPEDISIAGYDNIDRSVDYRIPLTTVAQEHYGMGRLAANILLDRMQGKITSRPVREYIQPKLIVRKSAQRL